MKRKLMAMLLIVCMMFGSSLTTFAATGTASGNSTVTGSGNVSYEDTVVYSVTLPTTSAVDLVIDPQGLSQLVSGNSASKEELAAGAGTITSANPIYVANCSSVPMKITVAMTMTGTGATAVTSEAAVEADTNPNVLLYAVPSSADTAGSTSENYVPSTTGLVLENAVKTANFVLDAADYVFTKNGDEVSYALKTDGEKHGFALMLEGKVNTKADWSSFVGVAPTSTIGYQAVFSFAAAAEDDVAVSGNGVYGMMDDFDGTAITVEARDVEATFTNGDVAGTIKFTKGTGNAGLDEIKEILLKDSKGSYFDVSKDLSGAWYGAEIDEENGVITINSLAINKFGLASSDVKVTYVNNAGETVTTEPFAVTLK